MSEVKRNLVEINKALAFLNRFNDFRYGVKVDKSDLVLYKQWARRGRNPRFDCIELVRCSKIYSMRVLIETLIKDREYR